MSRGTSLNTNQVDAPEKLFAFSLGSRVSTASRGRPVPKYFNYENGLYGSFLRLESLWKFSTVYSPGSVVLRVLPAVSRHPGSLAHSSSDGRENRVPVVSVNVRTKVRFPRVVAVVSSSGVHHRLDGDEEFRQILIKFSESFPGA